MSFTNSYDSHTAASSYATLEFPNTYYLAFRDLPEIIKKHANSGIALDFGCGAGRSTRFIRNFGYTTTGVDISLDMINQAKGIDPEGDYRLMPNGDFSMFNDNSFDLIMSAFTFDNIYGMDFKISIFKEFKRILKKGGKIINLVSSSLLYSNEWASFTTKDFPQNKIAKTDDIVKVINTDVPYSGAVDDVFCPEDSYKEIYKSAELEEESVYSPLADGTEPYEWINETEIAPWNIFVIKNPRF